MRIMKLSMMVEDLLALGSAINKHEYTVSGDGIASLEFEAKGTGSVQNHSGVYLPGVVLDAVLDYGNQRSIRGFRLLKAYLNKSNPELDYNQIRMIRFSILDGKYDRADYFGDVFIRF